LEQHELAILQHTLPYSMKCPDADHRQRICIRVIRPLVERISESSRIALRELQRLDKTAAKWVDTATAAVLIAEAAELASKKEAKGERNDQETDKNSNKNNNKKQNSGRKGKEKEKEEKKAKAETPLTRDAALLLRASYAQTAWQSYTALEWLRYGNYCITKFPVSLYYYCCPSLLPLVLLILLCTCPSYSRSELRSPNISYHHQSDTESSFKPTFHLISGTWCCKTSYRAARSIES
jgi:hypothetical protein